MSTIMKANAELELRPLLAHELDMVSGGLAPQVTFTPRDSGFQGRHGNHGADSLYGALYTNVLLPPTLWQQWSAAHGAAHLQLRAGV